MLTYECKRLTTQGRTNFLLQAANDAVANASHILVAEGFIRCLVSDPVSQALLPCPDLIVTIYVKQADICYKFSTGLANELHHPLAG
jgi:hypothetical protein